MILRPLLITRIANAVPGVALAAVAWPLTDVAPPNLWFVRIAAVATGLVLTVRGYRMSVVVTRGHITVRGLLRSRAIRGADVEALTPLPSLRWRRPSGRHGHTPLLMFMELTPAHPAVKAHNEVCLERLSKALR